MDLSLSTTEPTETQGEEEDDRRLGQPSVHHCSGWPLIFSGLSQAISGPITYE